MKKNIVKSFMALALSAGLLSSCGNDYLETDIFDGVDLDGGVSTPNDLKTALSGTYYRFFYSYFCGNYAINIGDVLSDLSYWNGGTGHWDGLYQCNYNTTDTYLRYIWEYGYKVEDNAARIIQSGEEMLGTVSSDADKKAINTYLAEAYALRGYATLRLVNVYGHQVKVAGKDFGSEKGIVLVDAPIAAFSEVSRATVKENYDQCIADLKKSISYFAAAGSDRNSSEEKFYFNAATANAILARAYMYLEDWSNAKSAAEAALAAAGNPSLVYTAAGFKALWNSNISNTEAFMSLAIDATNNWGANSLGTLWSTYNFSPNLDCLALFGENDVRKSVQEFNAQSTPSAPVYMGGIYGHYSDNNPNFSTCYVATTSEMYLIIAEAEINLGNESAAKEALLTVAKRNLDITSTEDLPSGADLYKFLKDERGRELFQLGFRFFDIRRWNDPVNLVAYAQPENKYTYPGFRPGDWVLPIPESEVNSGFGVEQNETWHSSRPQ